MHNIFQDLQKKTLLMLRRVSQVFLVKKFNAVKYAKNNNKYITFNLNLCYLGETLMNEENKLESVVKS